MKSHTRTHKCMYLYVCVCEYACGLHMHILVCMYRRWSDFDNSPAALLSICTHTCIRVRAGNRIHACVCGCTEQYTPTQMLWMTPHAPMALLTMHTHIHIHICTYVCTCAWVHCPLLYFCFFFFAVWALTKFYFCLSARRRERGRKKEEGGREGNLFTFPHI